MTESEMATRINEIRHTFQLTADPPNHEELCGEVCGLAGQAKENGWWDNFTEACAIHEEYCEEAYGACGHCEIT